MAAPQQGGGQSDNSTGIIWGVSAVFVAIGVIWYVFKNYIVAIYLSIKLYEVKFLSLFNSQYFEQLQSVITTALANPGNVTYRDLLIIGDNVGDWLRIPFVTILFLLAIIIYFGNTTRVFKQIYTMKDLAKLEKVNWPQISPTIHLDLIKEDIDRGPWAMAMTPMQFCKHYKLLEEVRPQRREGVSRKEWDKISVVLKRGESNKIFAMQLGQMWKGSHYLPPYIKTLFAVFAARINADSKEAERILRQASESSLLNLTGVEELLKKHENTKAVQQIIQSHAYVFTVMASMLEKARDDGVQSSADFLWLKPKDRRLWYTLNVVGRQTPFVEVAGIFAHWVAEKTAGRKLLVPMVEEATRALELALAEVVYRPDET